MNLFILAAGKGTRLYPLTKHQPKSLIKLKDGSTILERQIEVALESQAFERILIITGYHSAMIEDRITKYEDRNVEVIFNPYFDLSNNLLSLWTAHFLLEETDFVISNGDNIYRRGIYQRIFESADDETIQLTVDTKEAYDDDDMKVTLNAKGHVVRVSKLIGSKEADRESLGLVVVRGAKHRRAFHRKLMELVREPAMMQSFWLEIFNALVASGETIQVCDVPEKDWAEIDFHPDIETLQRAITANLFD